ncbi:hypothetical protein ABIE41_000183 [Bosea sp. OAE506]|uniref:hypothetical protein n=1 Tax=Bosea sp. OAE506 TaxID=2663870 RepID=UPI0019FC6C9E
MLTARKTHDSIRQGGPGASFENAQEAPDPRKPGPRDPAKSRSDVSGGGGERDRHHSHVADGKGKGTV